MTPDSHGGGVVQTVYVVATVHDGSPHPRVEGVYRDESDAKMGKKEALNGLKAIAAEVHKMEVR